MSSRDADPRERDDFWLFEHSGWEKAAPRYEASWTDLTRGPVPELLAAVAAGPGKFVLDVCCGPGFVSEAAARLGAVPIAVDFSGQMLRRARERNADLPLVQGDAQRLPLASASCDCVAINFGVNHLSWPESAFAEARRVLKAGGRLGFTVWARPEENPGVALIDAAIEAHAVMNVGIPQGPSAQRFCDENECRRELGEAGFDASTVSVQMVTFEWQRATAGSFFEAERDGGVRTTGLLARQTPERLAAIRAEIEKAVQPFANEAGYALPMAATVVAAVAR